MASLLLKNWRPAGGRPAPGSSDGDGRGASSRLDLRLEDGVIVAMAPDLGPLPLDRQVDLEGAFLLPGLIDCHVHLTLGGAGARANARAHLAAGVTALRSLGDRGEPPGFWPAGAAVGAVPPLMPTAVSAGRALAPAGRYGGFLGREVQPGEPLGRLVQEEVDRGAQTVKVVLSGSVDFERGLAEGPYFGAGDLAEIVAAARSLGVPVACHANGYPSVRLAAAAGVASIEHGILAGDEGVRAMAEAGVCWVPTLTPLHNLAVGGRWPGLPRILESHKEAVSRGVELGLAVLPGTDAGSPGVPHGSIFTELSLLASAGLSADALAAAATWRSAGLLGLPRDYGRLTVGASTDLVWFRHDPLAGSGPPSPPLGAVLAGRLAAAVDLSPSA